MNVVFKTGTNAVSIEFNDMSNAAQVAKAKWRYDSLASVFLLAGNAAVVIRTNNAKDYTFSFNGVNGLPVSFVDDTAPTTNEHLFELLSSIIN